MTRVVGVRWREADPVTYASVDDLTLPLKSYVVIQLEKSQELAWVCRGAAELVASEALACSLSPTYPPDFGADCWAGFGADCWGA